MIHLDISGRVATLLLDDEKSYNAFDETQTKELVEHLRQLKTRSDIDFLIIKGKGKAFSSGGNVKLMKEAVDGDDPAAYMKSVLPFLRESILLLNELPQLTIAVINGACAGAGLGIALQCDLRVMNERAKLIPGFIKLAGIPDTAVSYNLPKLIGYSQALEFLLLSPSLSATEAKELGIITFIYSTEEELETYLSKFKNLPRYAMKETKRLLKLAFQVPLADHLKEEETSMIQAALNPDHKEGVNAFVEKRSPHYPSLST